MNKRLGFFSKSLIDYKNILFYNLYIIEYFILKKIIITLIYLHFLIILHKLYYCFTDCIFITE